VRIAYLTILSLLLLSACVEGVDYKGKSLSKGWSYDDPLTQLISEDFSSGIAIVINHSDQYEYQNLYLTISAKLNTESVYQDTLSVMLADDSGYWLGDCKSEQCAYTYAISNTGRIDEISISQFSRDSILMGITSIDIDLLDSSK